MSKSDVIETTGTVTDVLPNSTFKVKLDINDHSVLCYLGGRLKQHKIKIVLGDSVRLEMSPYDTLRGRITFRL